ncbi:hypothetical protein AHAS_Ahas20G0061300 [Arachis hypogaea]
MESAERANLFPAPPCPTLSPLTHMAADPPFSPCGGPFPKSDPSTLPRANPCRRFPPVPVPAASRFPSPKGPSPISFVNLPSGMYKTPLRLQASCLFFDC